MKNKNKINGWRLFVIVASVWALANIFWITRDVYTPERILREMEKAEVLREVKSHRHEPSDGIDGKAVVKWPLDSAASLLPH